MDDWKQRHFKLEQTALVPALLLGHFRHFIVYMSWFVFSCVTRWHGDTFTVSADLIAMHGLFRGAIQIRIQHDTEWDYDHIESHTNIHIELIMITSSHEWTWGWDTLSLTMFHAYRYQSDRFKTPLSFSHKKGGRSLMSKLPASQPLTFNMQGVENSFTATPLSVFWQMRLWGWFSVAGFFGGWQRWSENETPKWINDDWSWKLWTYFLCVLAIVEAEVTLLWWRNWSCSLEDKEVSSKHSPFREAAREGRWKGVKMEHEILIWP